MTKLLPFVLKGLQGALLLQLSVCRCLSEPLYLIGFAETLADGAARRGVEAISVFPSLMESWGKVDFDHFNAVVQLV